MFFLLWSWSCFCFGLLFHAVTTCPGARQGKTKHVADWDILWEFYWEMWRGWQLQRWHHVTCGFLSSLSAARVLSHPSEQPSREVSNHPRPIHQRTAKKENSHDMYMCNRPHELQISIWNHNFFWGSKNLWLYLQDDNLLLRL